MRAISGFLWKTWWCLQYPPLPTSPGDGREILQWRHLGSFVCGPPPRHRFLCQPGRFRGQKWGLADLDRLGVTQLPSLQEYLPWATQEKWQPARCRLPFLEMDHQKLRGWDRVWSAKGHASSTWSKSSSVKSWQKQPSRARVTLNSLPAR